MIATAQIDKKTRIVMAICAPRVDPTLAPDDRYFRDFDNEITEVACGWVHNPKRNAFVKPEVTNG